MYLIQTFDKPGVGEQRLAIRMKHLRYLDQTKDLLAACGAKLDEVTGQPTGSLYLVNVATYAEAEQYIANDPFAKADLFERIEIQPWRKAFLDGKRYVEIDPE